jgi:hypothetical protein
VRWWPWRRRFGLGRLSGLRCLLAHSDLPVETLTNAPLGASERVDVLHALRQRHFKPTVAAILRPEHLAIACRDIDLLGVAVMRADRHQRAVRRHLVEALPALTVGYKQTINLLDERPPLCVSRDQFTGCFDVLAAD